MRPFGIAFAASRGTMRISASAAAVRARKAKSTIGAVPAASTIRVIFVRFAACRVRQTHKGITVAYNQEATIC